MFKPTNHLANNVARSHAKCLAHTNRSWVLDKKLLDGPALFCGARLFDLQDVVIFKFAISQQDGKIGFLVKCLILNTYNGQSNNSLINRLLMVNG